MEMAILIFLFFYFVGASETKRRIFGFGWNQYGELGVGDLDEHSSPVFVGKGNMFDSLSSLGEFNMVIAGFRHTYLRVGNSIYGFGNDHNCVLGFGEEWNTYQAPVIIRNLNPENKIVQKVSSNFEHSIMVTDDGAIATWGKNEYGQLGTGYLNNECQPKAILDKGGVDVSSGWYHSIFVKSDGTAWGMGCSSQFQIGNSQTINKSPIQIKVNNAISASAGESYSLFLTSDKTVYIVGEMLCGQDVKKWMKPTVLDFESHKISQIHAGIYHFLVLSESGEVYGYGCPAYYCLGENATIPFIPTKIDLSMMDKRDSVKKVVAMYFSTIVLTERGNVLYMGQDLSQNILLNNEGWSYPTLTFLIDDDDDVIIEDISASTSHLTAVSNDSMYCWGENWFYECGILPRKWVTSFQKSECNEFQTYQVTNLFLSNQHAMALTAEEGKYYTWGVNSYGQLGTGSYLNHYFPVTLSLPHDHNQHFIDGDCNEQSCIVIDDRGNPYVFGSGDEGCLGTNSLQTEFFPNALDLSFFGGNTLKTVRSGDSQVHAIDKKGNLWSWGVGVEGELGFGVNTTFSLKPMKNQLPKFSENVDQISVGKLSAAIVTKENEIYFWGLVADDPNFNSFFEPQKLDFDDSDPYPQEKVTMISVGCQWIVIVKNYIHIYVFGKIGDSLNLPIIRFNDTAHYFATAPKRMITCYSMYHTLCVLEDGSLYGFGNSDHNQLLLPNSETYTHAFVAVTDETIKGINFSRVLASDHTSIVMESVKCFGKFDSEADVCSGHGICADNDHCVCNYGWTHDDCSVFTCNGISHLNESVCSGHGECTDIDNCECQNHWSNFDQRLSQAGVRGANEFCKYPLCKINEYKICSGRGECVVKDNKPYCFCNETSIGEMCENFRCGSLPRNYSGTSNGCNFLSSCAKPQHCVCDTKGFYALAPFHQDSDYYGGCVVSYMKIILWCFFFLMIVVFILLGFVAFSMLSLVCCCCSVRAQKRKNFFNGGNTIYFVENHNYQKKDFLVGKKEEYEEIREDGLKDRNHFFQFPLNRFWKDDLSFKVVHLKTPSKNSIMHLISYNDEEHQENNYYASSPSSSALSSFFKKKFRTTSRDGGFGGLFARGNSDNRSGNNILNNLFSDLVSIPEDTKSRIVLYLSGYIEDGFYYANDGKFPIDEFLNQFCSSLGEFSSAQESKRIDFLIIFDHVIDPQQFDREDVIFFSSSEYEEIFQHFNFTLEILFTNGKENFWKSFCHRVQKNVKERISSLFFPFEKTLKDKVLERVRRDLRKQNKEKTEHRFKREKTPTLNEENPNDSLHQDRLDRIQGKNNEFNIFEEEEQREEDSDNETEEEDGKDNSRKKTEGKGEGEEEEEENEEIERIRKSVHFLDGMESDSQESDDDDDDDLYGGGINDWRFQKSDDFQSKISTSQKKEKFINERTSLLKQKQKQQPASSFILSDDLTLHYKRRGRNNGISFSFY